MDTKKLFLTKTKYGASLNGAELYFDDKPWEVCGLAKQELRNELLYQWWIIMPKVKIY